MAAPVPRGPALAALQQQIAEATTVEQLEALEAECLRRGSMSAFRLAQHARGRIRAFRAVATRRARDPERWKAKPKEARPPTLFQFLGGIGGLQDQGGELAALGITRTITTGGALVRKGGLPLDRAREAATEAGYIGHVGQDVNGADGTTIQQLLDALDREARGRKVYPLGLYADEGLAPLEAQDPEAELHDMAQAQATEAAHWRAVVELARTEGHVSAWAYLVEHAGLAGQLVELEELPW